MPRHLPYAVAAALLLAALASPVRAQAQTVYYLDADSGTAVGADGTTNVVNGQTGTSTGERALLATSAPNGTSTYLSVTPWSTTGTMYVRFYGPAYAAPTNIAANPSASLYLLAAASGDTFTFRLVDHNPGGTAGNGTVIASQTKSGLSQSYSRQTISFSSSLYTVPANHRLVLEVWYQPFNSGENGRLAFNSSTYASTVTVTESAAASTIVGDNSGTEAATGTSVCASTASSTAFYDVDHFTLSTSSGADTVTRVTVNVTAGNAAIGTLYVTDDTGATIYGSLASPAAGSNAITVSIPVSTTVTQYRIQARPALYSALASGSNYTITAQVVGGTATNPVTNNDANGGSVIVDRTPPSTVTWGAVSTSTNTVNLAWTNPAAPWVSTVILRSASGASLATTSLIDGTPYVQGNSSGADSVAYVGSGTTDADATGAGTYSYRAFAADACNNYSAGAASGPYTPPSAPSSTTVLGLSGTATSCTQVTLVASYSGDGNGTNSVTFTRNGAAITCASLTRNASGSGGTWTCVDGSVPSVTTTYTYAATFTDADGVSGTNPATATAAETACLAGGGTLTLAADGTNAAATVSPGQTNAAAGRFTLTATSASVYVDRILLSNAASPAATSADLESVNVYVDSGNTGVYASADTLVATANWSPSASAWVVSGFTQPLGTTNYLVTASAAYGATQGNKFTLSFSTASITVDPKASLAGATTIAGGTLTIGSLSSSVGKPPGDNATNGTSKVPMVLILNPGNGSTVSLSNPGNTVRVQVQVYDPSRTSISSVAISKDNFATSTALTLNGAYGSVVGAYAGIYQADLPSTALPAGTWTLQAVATSTGGGTAYSAPIIVSVNPQGVGDGNLLVRNNSNQLCIDCHAVQSHNAQSVSNPRTGISRYGSWGATCRDCHTPHKTHNAQLIRETIAPPAYSGTWQAARSVQFRDRKTGDSGTSGTISFVTSSPASTVTGPFGPCQACHTRTSNRTGTPRWRNTGNSDTHYIGSSTQQCTTCHSHANGFAGRESTGGEYCGKCHSGLFWSMQASGTTSPAMPHLTKHTLGPGILGTNDNYANTSLTWGSPLSANAPASRSCVAMCHGDHVHNDPLTWPAETHNNNFYKNAATQASRALTRDANTSNSTYGFATAASTGSLYVKTDFVSGQYTQGCIACHTNPVDSSHPAISGTAYDASAHDVTTTPGGSTWEYVLHDDNQGGTPSYTSRFTRNCTKCHAGNQAEGQTVSWGGSVQGVHYSDNPSLLGGAVNPAGNAGSLVCYNCHGNGTTGKNYSNKDVATEVASSYYHPVNASSTHDTVSEDASTWGGGLYAGANRHVTCLDCHDPHMGGKVKHTSATATSNAIATTSPLYGASGVAVSYSGVGLWTAVPSANFSAVGNAAYEYQICFKCHTSWAWGSGSAPTALATGGSGLAETDLSTEFNPGNRSGHPVAAPLNSYTGALSTGVHALAAGQLIAPWNANAGKQTMACSDCHGNDNTGSTIVQGPHGSVGKFILKGPNTQWPTQADGVTAWSLANYTTGAGTSAGLFCLNCHPDPKTTNGAHTNGNHSSAPCFGCHIIIPHGGKLSRLIAQGGTSNMPARYCYQGNKANCYIDGGFQRSATYTSYGDSQCGSSVAGTGTGGCNTQHASYHPTEQW
ncbi:MAG TPA: hypothetical protein VFE30_02055 [Anaeromyxobacteraceae bacterium]|nr:hypothetical protein [Anaeromyxobacteraceae bacterium]